MLKKMIKYTDYNGVERNEPFFFNLSEAEITEMQLSAKGGLDNVLKNIIEAQDGGSIMRMFKEILLKSYGEKSEDGKRFIKIANDGHRLADDFAQTEAYSILFMELATDSAKAADFVNAIIPSSIKLNELPTNITSIEDVNSAIESMTSENK